MEDQELPVSGIEAMEFSVEILDDFGALQGVRIGKCRGTDLICIQRLNADAFGKPDFIETHWNGTENDVDLYVTHIALLNGDDTIKRLRAFCDMYDAITKKGPDQ